MKNKLLIAVLILTMSFINCSNIQAVGTKSHEEQEINLGQQIADYAQQFVGNPYVWGGTSLTNGADCSGFALAVMEHFDIELERIANDQFNNGEVIDWEDKEPGDLIFYGYGSSYADHTAIYIGNDQIVHARNSQHGIVISDCDYWNYIGVRRYW